jgi:hypothetical protein
MVLFKKDDLKGDSSDFSTAIALDAPPHHDTAPSSALELYDDVIIEVLRARGVDAHEAYKPDSGLWIVPAQPAPIILRVLRAEDEEDVDYIEAVMRLGPLPAQNLLAFYRALLESNTRLANAAFAISSDGVFLRQQRPLAGLDEDELNDIISALIHAASAEFGELLEQFVFGASILR